MVRAALVLLCVAGIVVSLISYRSQKSFNEGFERVSSGQLDDSAREQFEDARTLNPDVRIDFFLALIARERGEPWEPLIRDTIEREPENAGLHAQYATLLAEDGRDADAQRAYARASELDPQRFPPRRGGS